MSSSDFRSAEGIVGVNEKKFRRLFDREVKKLPFRVLPRAKHIAPKAYRITAGDNIGSFQEGAVTK